MTVQPLGQPGDGAGQGAGDGVDLVSAYAIEEDRDAEATLRPRKLAEMIAQHRVREQLDLLLRSAMRRGSPPEHILLSGPPGLGKTTLASIMANEMNAALVTTAGPSLDRGADLMGEGPLALVYRGQGPLHPERWHGATR